MDTPKRFTLAEVEEVVRNYDAGPRVAHVPPHRRAWIAHTYDCARCGYWKHGLTGILARPELCAAGARLLVESQAEAPK